ncbi:hydroxymethylglutaryl-CoA synthase [Apilactobacillus apinorum]|nr:hydroxymethylglutaryl-CoA synthase [Apilactobacillus apinorum]KOY68980.1 Hydroxymethylglutaryl-CoA synthase [Apilactobacillus apinorum]CAI2678575.1 Hydroxymethylglutaryl-CoA synthase [Apilactobacillus apinorum]
MNVGIDKMSFYSSDMYLDMVDLAHARNEDPNKYLIGIGQKKMAVIPKTQDVVTMAANACLKIIDDDDRNKIDLIIFGTETGIDNSKSAAIYLQNMLGLSRRGRAFEIKQACYGATAGLQMAKEYVENNPEKKALVIGADIARYGIDTPGEVTQGGGAVAMVISANPSIAEFEGTSTFYSDDVMDFWRPLYRTEAVVDGHYSNDVYVDFFKKTWDEYKQITGKNLEDFSAMTFHLPYVKMGIKALRAIIDEASEEHQDKLKTEFGFGKVYNENIGNLYTGSLYLNFLSLINNSDQLKVGDRIGLFSYGSGAQGEFFAMNLCKGFKNSELISQINADINNRKQVSVSEYETIFNDWVPIKDQELSFDTSKDASTFTLKGVKNHQRIYDRK